jgi:hypothetical protein
MCHAFGFWQGCRHTQQLSSRLTGSMRQEPTSWMPSLILPYPSCSHITAQHNKPGSATLQHPILIVCPCAPTFAYSVSIQIFAWLTVRDSSHATFHLFSLAFVDLLVLIVPYLFDDSNELNPKPFSIAPRLVSQCRREHDG